MIQFCADSINFLCSFESFCNYLNSNQTEIIRKIYSMFKKEKLFELWKKRFDQILIKRTVEELEKQAEIVLGYLVFF